MAGLVEVEEVDFEEGVVINYLVEVEEFGDVEG